jgi:hypothetical protein
MPLRGTRGREKLPVGITAGERANLGLDERFRLGDDARHRARDGVVRYHVAVLAGLDLGSGNSLKSKHTPGDDSLWVLGEQQGASIVGDEPAFTYLAQMMSHKILMIWYRFFALLRLAHFVNPSVDGSCFEVVGPTEAARLQLK